MDARPTACIDCELAIHAVSFSLLRGCGLRVDMATRGCSGNAGNPGKPANIQPTPKNHQYEHPHRFLSPETILQYRNGGRHRPGRIGSSGRTALTPTSTPTVEERFRAGSAPPQLWTQIPYFANGDPASSLPKDSQNGNVVDGHASCDSRQFLRAPAANAWQMTCAALVLFMTLARPVRSFLRRPGAAQENVLSVGDRPMLFHRRPRHHPLVGGGLQHRLLQWLAVVRQPELPVSARRHLHAEPQLFHRGFPKCFRDVPAHVCDHHPGAHCGRYRGANEIFRRHALHDPVDVCGLFSAGSHGLGHRWLDERRRQSRGEDQSDGLRRRHGGAYVLRLVRPHSLHDSREARRIRQGAHGPA